MIENISRKKIIISSVVSVALIIILGRSFYGKKTIDTDTPVVLKSVKTVELKTISTQDVMNVQGVVKAESKIDVVALANGTVKQLNLKVGERVLANQPLAELYDSALLTNLVNASVNANNISQNYQNTSKVTDEAVKQSQVGLSRAQESVVLAEIGLKTAQDNYENAKRLTEKNRKDIKSNAVIAYENYLNTINSFLSQANYIIKAEGSDQLQGVGLTLSARNSQALTDSINSYLVAKNHYGILAKNLPTVDNVDLAIGGIMSNLTEAKKLADNMIDVLNNTVPHSQFSDAALSAQKASFTGLRSTIIGTQTAAQGTLQGIQNIELTSKQQLDGALNSLKAAESQLIQAQLALDSSRSGLSSSEKSKQQQLDLTRTTLDGAQGQYQLLSEQANNLTVKAPISGEITSKNVEVGTEVRIGQKVAEIAKVDSIKIVVGLSPEDATRVKLGQEVVINGKFKGVVNQIAPAADATNKKIQIEVIYDNENRNFIPETLVDMEIPLKSVGPSGSGVYRLPLNVLTVGQNENFIFVFESGKAKKVNVTLDRIDGESAYVRTDLPSESMVIIEGNKLLEDGELVILNK